MRLELKDQNRVRLLLKLVGDYRSYLAENRDYLLKHNDTRIETYELEIRNCDDLIERLNKLVEPNA